MRKKSEMGLQDKAIQKAERLTLIGLILAAIFGGVYLLTPPAHAEQMFENETDINTMFMYSPPSFDSRPLTLDVQLYEYNETGHSVSSTLGTVTAYGNISVISNPVGWDLFLEMQIVQTITLLVIAICLGILTIFFLMRLNK